MKVISKKEAEVIYLNDLGFPIYEKLKSDEDLPDNWKPSQTQSWCFEEYDYKAIIPELPIGFKVESSLFSYEVVKYITLFDIKYIIYLSGENVNISPYYLFYTNNQIYIDSLLNEKTPLRITLEGTDLDLSYLLLEPNEESSPINVETTAKDYDVFINPTDLATFSKDTRTFLAKRIGVGYIDVKATAEGNATNVVTIPLNIQDNIGSYKTKLNMTINDNNKLLRVGDEISYTIITDAFKYEIESLDPEVVSVDKALKKLIMRKSGFARIKVVAKKDGFFETSLVKNLKVIDKEAEVPNSVSLSSSVEKLETVSNALHYINIYTDTDFANLSITNTNDQIMNASLVDAEGVNPIRLKVITKQANGSGTITIRAIKDTMQPKEIKVYMIVRNINSPESTLVVEPIENQEILEQESIKYTITSNGEYTYTASNPDMVNITKEADGVLVTSNPNFTGDTNILFENTTNGVASAIVKLTVKPNAVP